MCYICNLLKDKDNIVMENETSFLFKYKESNLHSHMMVATKQHKENYFDITYKENEDMFMLLKNYKSYLDNQISPDGYSIGYDVGTWAGQQFNHVYMHMIPRFAGDVPITELKNGISNSVMAFRSKGEST